MIGHWSTWGDGTWPHEGERIAVAFPPGPADMIDRQVFGPEVHAGRWMDGVLHTPAGPKMTMESGARWTTLPDMTAAGPNDG